MNLREAAEMALEALENIDRWLPTIGQKGLRDYEADAIQALRQALAEDALNKEWIGLTDADIFEAMQGSVEGSNILPYQFARAIDKFLEEKNT